MRSLSKYSQLAQPLIQASGLPTMSVAGKQQLMPVPTTAIARNLESKLFLGSSFDERAAFFRARGIAHRLVLQIAAITDELPEECDAIVRPYFGRCRLRCRPGDGKAIAGAKFADLPPTPRRIETMLSGRANLASARQQDFQNRLVADAPYEIGLGARDASAFGHR